MTLVDATLSIINDEWPGGVPSDVVLINQNDSTDITGTRRRDRERATDIVVRAGFATGDESRKGHGKAAVRRTVTIAITGTHDGDEYGTIDGDDDFETILDAVKQALRTRRESPPPTVPPHSETWHEFTPPANEVDNRPNHHDNYGVAFDITWLGHT